MHTSIFRVTSFHIGAFHFPHWFALIAVAGVLFFTAAVVAVVFFLLHKSR